MPKLSDYVEMAAAEYFQETGKEVLDSFWVAEFFQDCGVQDAYPNQNLVDFYALVQSALTRNIEGAEKQARLHLNDANSSATRRRKPAS